MIGCGRFLRDNAFLVAAVALPVVVVLFFLVATAIPSWTVAAPGYDALLRVGGVYDQSRARATVDFTVRDGVVEATVRPVPVTGYPQPWMLFLFDHTTMSVREVPVGLPATIDEHDPPKTIVVSTPANRRVMPQPTAPDGYALASGTYRSPGIMGDLFGMHRYDQTASLVKEGRTIPIALPSPYQYQSPVYLIGWLVDDGTH